jgi:hypothetical protein
MDLDLIEIIEDAGVSAKSIDRAGLQRALDILERGRADGILIAKLDRLTRSVRDLGDLVERYFAARFALLSVSDSIDTRTAAGLRGDYKQADYGKVILPLTVLRRLDCVLDKTKAKVLTKHQDLKLGAALQRALYGFYGHATGATHHLSYGFTPEFVTRLSMANSGTGTDDPGWRVARLEDDGSVLVEKAGVAIWAKKREIARGGGIVESGTTTRLRVPKEFRALVPGFYMALGDADIGEDALGVRYYWHVTSEGAAPLMAALTCRLNRSSVPFRLKVPNHPLAYQRADAGVLYLGRAANVDAHHAIRETHAVVRRFLRPDVPRFSLRLGFGVGFAEESGGLEGSFGMHRCGVVAEGLLSAFKHERVTRDGRADEIARAFLRRGLDPSRPYRARGSCPYEPASLAPEAS